MKNIYKVIISLVICFLPVMVDAKVNFEYQGQYFNRAFGFKENNEYFFFDESYNYNADGYIKIYDKNGKKLREDKLFDDVEYSEVSIIESKYFNQFFKYLSDRSGVAYDSENKLIYNVDYYDNYFYRYSDEGYVSIDFDDDTEFTKKLLGKKYDIILAAKNEGSRVNFIMESYGYYSVYYRDYRGYNYAVVLNEELEIVATFNNNNYNVILHVYNDLLFVMEDNINLNVYDMKGNEIGHLIIENEYVSNDENYAYCDTMYPELINFVDDELFIFYDTCDKRVNYDDESFYDSVGESLYIDYMTLKYQMKFEIDKVESNNGDFTYVEKEDEDGKSYVELKITPKNGYIVDKIIVTDTNGNKIEVTDNKFYKPLNDIKIEVQYKIAGEYVPIPDTFLGRSITLIMIGLILIGLGVYTVNYVKN